MKKILFFISLGISVLIIIHLVTSIYTLWHKQDLLTQAQKELQKEQAENKKLQHQLKIVSTDQFVEEEARNKLFMVKPGEGEILIAQVSQAQKVPHQQDTSPNWKKWLDLFSL